MENWHGKPLGGKSDEVIASLRNNMPAGEVTVTIAEPVDDAPVVDIENVALSTPPSYAKGDMVATRLAYGTAIAKLAQNNPRVVALDGDTKNSTYSEHIKKVGSFSARLVLAAGF